VQLDAGAVGCSEPEPVVRPGDAFTASYALRLDA